MEQLSGIDLKAESYKIDLKRIGGDGEFRCPRCGIEISPDDETEDVYSILKTVAAKDKLEKVILRCNRCGSHLSLVGFQIFDNSGKIRRELAIQFL